MRVNHPTRFAAMALLVGALACAGNTAREADTDETAAARDTTTNDTLGGQAQNRPENRGMEGDSVNTPQYPETSDTFLQNQGPGQPGDTAGSTGTQSGEPDTTGAAGQDTSSMGTDTTSMKSGDMDSTSMAPPGDTTGYNKSQDQNQPDTTTSR